MNNTVLLSLFKKKKRIRYAYTLIILFSIVLYILTFASFAIPDFIPLSIILVIIDVILLALMWYFHFKYNKIICKIELYRASSNK